MTRIPIGRLADLGVRVFLRKGAAQAVAAKPAERAVFIEALAGPQASLAEMERLLAHLRASRLRPGFDAIRLPGERAQRAEADGGPVPDDLLELLNGVGRRHALDPLP